MTIQERKWLEQLMQEKLADTMTATQLSDVTGALQQSFADMELAEIRTDSIATGEDQTLKVYLQAKKIEGRSERTIQRYSYILERFLQETKTPTSSVTTYTIRHWLASELERGISMSTTRGYQLILSSYFGWAWKEQLIRSNPCANIGPIKVPKIKKEPFSSIEIEVMKENCRSSRDKAIICFLLATGCRIDEATRLNREDIDFEHKEVKVYGKGSKERVVFMDDISTAMLFRYFADRKDNSPALFTGRKGGRLHPDAIRKMMKRLEARSEVVNIYPHRFRRTLATNLARKGMSIQEIAAILGHEQITTTERYITLEQTQVKSHYRAIVA